MKSAFHSNCTMKMTDRRYFFDLDMKTGYMTDNEGGIRLIIIPDKYERRIQFFAEGGA